MKETTLCITVSDDLQSIILPPYGVTFGVSGDVNVNEIRMKLPKECKGFNLIRFVPRINYVNANGDANYYETVMESDESNCYFIWPITPDITVYTGHVRFSLTLYQTEEGIILHKFNTRSATGQVYTGFEAEKQVTPEQQQTLLGKLETQIKADLNDHTEKLKGELTEKGKEILDGFGESGSVSEELKTIKQDLGTKLTAPPTPEVGKILKIRSVNEDGTFTCEWADDGGSNLDVRINGESIVQDGVAEIPVAVGDIPGTYYGLVHMVSGYCYGITTGKAIESPGVWTNDALQLVEPGNFGIDYRKPATSNGFGAINTTNLDYAVKAAMCDGKGAAWTAEEQAAARARMGIGEWELVADITLEEKVNKISFTIESWKELFVRIDAKAVQDTVSTTVFYPFTNANFCDFYPGTGKDASIYVHMVKFDDYALYELSFNNISGNNGTPKSSIVKCSTNRLHLAREYFESGTTAKVWSR